MTSTLSDPSAVDTSRDAEPGLAARSLTSTDVLAGGALLVIALLAWASLILAHVGQHTALRSLLLAAVLLVVVVGIAARSRLRVPVRRDGATVAVALACAAVTAALTFPGFSYGVSDKDPGGYVSHAVEIARTGDYSFIDPVIAKGLPVQLQSPGARFPGVWVRDDATGQIVPQFYHLWTALLATSYDVGGYDGMRFAVPLMGVLAVLLIVAILRRVGEALAGPTAGLVAAAAGGLLLATNMLEVWQSRFPTTEVFAEALYLGSLLGLVITLQTRWRPAAGLAGLFVGIGWLNRADGLLLVLLSIAFGAALIATRKWDGRATWYAAGLAVVVPHAVLQAYDLARSYTIGNNVPTLSKVIAVTAASLILALLLRFPLRRPVAWVLALLDKHRTQVVIGALVLLVATALMVVGFLRPRLFGADYFQYNGTRIRSYDEQILRRLSWFFTLPGLALMLIGVAIVGLRRWVSVAWAIALPTLMLFAVYAYTAKNSTRMLWWTRRYVPTVLPGVLMLIALALALAFVYRYRGRAVLRVPSVLVLAGLVVAFLFQSLPLRAHDEWKGSFAVSQRVSDLSPNAVGVYLWEQQPCCNGGTQLFATQVWLAHDELSVLLPSDANRRTEIIDRYTTAFRGQPMFVVAGKGGLPLGIDPSTVTPVTIIRASLPMWDESDVKRPDAAHQIPVELRVWRVNGT